MDKADTLIAAYVEAGYSKIHLDCSMSCADDPDVLDDETVAQRTARLMRVAEDAAHSTSLDLPMYVIGTEVPVPGGAHETLDVLTPTPADRARRTIDAHRKAFADLGLDNVWPRVVALVVQPGVEFDHLHVIDYDRSADRANCGASSTTRTTWSSRRTPPTTSGPRSCGNSSKTTGPSSRSGPP